MTDTTLLVVDDDPALRLGLSESLRALGYAVEEDDGFKSACRRLEQGSAPDGVLLDLQLGDGSGLDLLPRLRETWPDTPVVVMTAHSSVTSAVAAMEQGAFTYLQKPLNTSELKVVLNRALDTGRLRRQKNDRRRRRADRFSFRRIVAHSDEMKKVLDQASRVAESPASTVLLLGESGTGKGLVARAIHYASDRSAEPFLTVTCSAIPEPLLEAQILGHEKGAFTDAKERRRGVFEAADGGTVFLDEIGDMPLALQAKLLGVLEDRTFCRVGSTDPIRVDVRIVAATHRDLFAAVEAGQFREDLLYRLRVVPIVIPPVRDRLKDIVPLTDVFIRDFNREFGRSIKGLTPAAEESLRAHSWPGNVRELRNVIERAMLFAETERLDAPDLLLAPVYRPRSLRAAPQTASVPAATGSTVQVAAPAAPQPTDERPFILPSQGVDLEKLENDLVRQALDHAGGNKSRAAKLLGISRDQIRYRLDKMNS